MSARTCPNCGHPLSANAHFCVNCGQAVPEVIPEIAAEHVPWRAMEGIGIFLIAFVAFVVLTLPLSLIIQNTDTVIGIGILLNEVLLFVTTVVWVRKVHGTGVRALGFRGVSSADVGIGFGIGLAGVVTSAIVTGILVAIIQNITNTPVEAPQQIPLEHAPSAALLVIIGIGTVVCAPIAEETFFRGFVFQGLRKWMRAVPAIMTSAVFFSVVHLIPLILLPIFVLGVLLAGLLERRGSIVPAIVAHATFNTVGFVFGYVLRK